MDDYMNYIKFFSLIAIIILIVPVCGGRTYENLDVINNNTNTSDILPALKGGASNLEICG